MYDSADSINKTINQYSVLFPNVAALRTKEYEGESALSTGRRCCGDDVASGDDAARSDAVLRTTTDDAAATTTTMLRGGRGRSRISR